MDVSAKSALGINSVPESDMTAVFHGVCWKITDNANTKATLRQLVEAANLSRFYNEFYVSLR